MIRRCGWCSKDLPARNSFGTARGCERHNKVDCDVCVSHGICDACLERELGDGDVSLAELNARTRAIEKYQMDNPPATLQQAKVALGFARPDDDTQQEQRRLEPLDPRD